MPAPPRDKRRLWMIRAVGVLLLLQSFWLAGTSIAKGGPFVWPLGETVLGGTLAPDQTATLTLGLPLTALATLGVLGAIGFLFMLSFGWVVAMILQGLTMFYCLSLYLQEKPSFVYPIMLYCIVMVLYLNSFDVRAAFRSRDEQP